MSAKNVRPCFDSDLRHNKPIGAMQGETSTIRCASNHIALAGHVSIVPKKAMVLLQRLERSDLL
jgi:hypothetical protein